MDFVKINRTDILYREISWFRYIQDIMLNRGTRIACVG